jgi:hypothetical protein
MKKIWLASVTSKVTEQQTYPLDARTGAVHEMTAKMSDADTDMLMTQHVLLLHAGAKEGIDCHYKSSAGSTQLPA